MNFWVITVPTYASGYSSGNSNYMGTQVFTN